MLHMEPKFSQIDDVANRVFDYIVVGGGLAGSVIASRLSEDPQRSVLLLEAGRGRIKDHAIDKPVPHPMWFREQMLGNPEYDWFFQSSPQEAVKKRIIPVSRGKGLGGSTNINNQMWTPPGREEIDSWVKFGNPGWGYEDLARCIRKAERFHAPSSQTIKDKALPEDQYWFGKNGPISISFGQVSTGLDEKCRSTAMNRGIPFIKDPGLGDYMGYWSSPAIIDPETNQRCSAFKGYILPHLDRKNLSIMTEAYVTKLLIKTGDNSKVNSSSSDAPVTAEGVQFIVDGKTYVAYAAKEVLLCAGSVQTPQVLELSGIGDPDVLQPLGIPVLVDLPGVGENLQEHFFAINLAFELRPDFECSTLDILRVPKEYEKEQKLYEEGKLGLLSFTTSEVLYTSLQKIVPDTADKIIARHEEEIAHRLSTLNADSKRYSLLKEQLDAQVAYLKNPSIAQIEFIFLPYISIQKDEPEPGKKYLSVFCGLVTALSRGNSHISSADPLQPPKIDFNMFGYPIELDILVEAFKWARQLKDYEPLKGIIVKEINPGSAVVADDEIRDYFRDSTFTHGHPTATSSMLPREKLGVVDPKLRVHGTTNVRVCDYSIPPVGVAVHPQCTAYGIAERAVEIILADG